MKSSFRVQGVDHIVVNVIDVVRSAAWYSRVLGMDRLEYGTDPEDPRTAMLFGSQRINLRPGSVKKDEWFTADNEAAGSDDLCFLTEASPKDTIAHLKACGVRVIIGPFAREGARGKLMSVYCRDPDSSLIEISTFTEDVAGNVE